MADISVSVEKELGVIATKPGDMTLQINVVKWNNGKPKVDIRSWNEDRSRMSKGLGFNKYEIKVLKELLNSIDIDNLEID